MHCFPRSQDTFCYYYYRVFHEQVWIRLSTTGFHFIALAFLRPFLNTDVPHFFNFFFESVLISFTTVLCFFMSSVLSIPSLYGLHFKIKLANCSCGIIKQYDVRQFYNNFCDILNCCDHPTTEVKCLLFVKVPTYLQTVNIFMWKH